MHRTECVRLTALQALVQYPGECSHPTKSRDRGAHLARLQDRLLFLAVATITLDFPLPLQIPDRFFVLYLLPSNSLLQLKTQPNANVSTSPPATETGAAKILKPGIES